MTDAGGGRGVGARQGDAFPDAADAADDEAVRGAGQAAGPSGDSAVAAVCRDTTRMLASLWPGTSWRVHLAGVEATRDQVSGVPSCACGGGAPSGGRHLRVGLRTHEGAAALGVLCGTVTPGTSPPATELLDWAARMLAAVAAAERTAQEQVRRAERAEADLAQDPETGLPDVRAWARLLDAEEARARRYGTDAGVVVVGLDACVAEEAPRAAEVLGVRRRAGDVLALVGPAEFAVLALEAGEQQVGDLAQRLLAALAEARLPASAGCQARGGDGLATAWRAAADRMRLARSGRARALAALPNPRPPGG